MSSMRNVVPAVPVFGNTNQSYVKYPARESSQIGKNISVDVHPVNMTSPKGTFSPMNISPTTTRSLPTNISTSPIYSPMSISPGPSMESPMSLVSDEFEREKLDKRLEDLKVDSVVYPKMETISRADYKINLEDLPIPEELPFEPDIDDIAEILIMYEHNPNINKY